MGLFGAFAEMEIESSSSGRFKQYEQLELQEFPDKFVIKSLEFPTRGFSIGRRDGNVEIIDGNIIYAHLWLFIN